MYTYRSLSGQVQGRRRCGGVVDHSMMKTMRCPALNQVVKAALSIFHGPVVESSFSLMNSIINTSRTKMNMSTWQCCSNSEVSTTVEAEYGSRDVWMNRCDVWGGGPQAPVRRNHQQGSTAEESSARGKKVPWIWLPLFRQCSGEQEGYSQGGTKGPGLSMLQN